MNTKRKRMFNSSSSSKACQVSPSSTGNSVNLGVLEWELMPEPQANADARNFNVRDNANCFYKGYRICRLFECETQTSPIEVHYAVIQFGPQVYERFTEDTSGFATEFKQKFFRDYSDQSDRAVDFNDYPATGATLWDMRKNCAAMNPNRGYRIIFHKKRILHPRIAIDNRTGADVPVDGGRRYFWKIDKWLKIGKRHTFENRSTTRSNTPFMEVFWTNTVFGQDMPSSNPGSVEAARTYRYHTLYFGDAAI